MGCGLLWATWAHVVEVELVEQGFGEELGSGATVVARVHLGDLSPQPVNRRAVISSILL